MRRIQLGLIGTGGMRFRQLYREALERLGKRIQVVVVYDPVEQRASQVADQFECSTSRSFRKIVKRSDLDALLMLDCGWAGLVPVVEALRQGTPFFLAPQASCNGEQRIKLQEELIRSDAFSVVEQSWIYSPAGLRCLELISLELKDVQQISIQIRPSQSSSKTLPDLIEAIEWIRHLFPGYDWQSIEVTSPQTTIQLTPPATSTKTAIQLQINTSDDETVLPLEIVSNGGVVKLKSPCLLEWSTDPSGTTEMTVEELFREPEAIMRQIDFFMRRVVGGLIPAHGLTDRMEAEAIAEKIGQ